MKKIVLVVLLALSLQAGSILCEDAHSRVLKYNKLFIFAAERNDKLDMELNVDMLILYTEKALAECGDGWRFEKATSELRRAMIDFSEELKKQ